LWSLAFWQPETEAHYPDNAAFRASLFAAEIRGRFQIGLKVILIGTGFEKIWLAQVSGFPSDGKFDPKVYEDWLLVALL